MFGGGNVPSTYEPAAVPMDGITPVAADAGLAAPQAAALTALAERVTELQDSLRAIDRKLDALSVARDRVDATSTASGAGVAVDAATLQLAIEAAQQKAERAKFEAMKPGEVLRSAEELINTRQDLGKARAMLEALLQRNLAPEERQRALLQLGLGHRAGKDFAAAQATLQQAIDLAGGTATEPGAWAAFQMAWNHQMANDPATARQWFAMVANSSGSGTALRLEGRWNAAKLGDSNDPATRAEWAAVLRDCGDDSEYRHIAEDVRARLERR